MRLIRVVLPLLAAASLGAAGPDGFVPAGPVSQPLAPPPPLRAETSDPAPLLPLRSSTPDAPMPVQTAPLPPPAPAMQVTYGPQKLMFPGGVNALFDVTYQTLKGYRPLTLDIYQPPTRPYPLPLLVFVHGGGFGGGDTRHAGTFTDFPRELAALAAQGYVVAAVNYRLSGEARFPAALLDVKAAIRWLRGKAGELNLDTTRTAVWGISSGGQLAALTGLTCGVPALEPPGEAACVQAVIDWYGASDLKAPAKPGFTETSASDAGDFLGCEPSACPPGLAKVASPLSYVSATSPGFLIQHGGADKTVPAEQSQALAAALRSANVPAELVIYPGAEHDLTRGGAPDPGLNRQALDKLAAFLAANFPPGPIGQKLSRRGSLY